MRELVINDIVINDDSACYVAAEVGHNHQGDLKTCMEMFHVANECGAKAVKLQKRNSLTLYTKTLYNQAYDNTNSYGKTYLV